MTALKYKTEPHRYTYQDYLGWDDDKRYEIINGIVYDISPAPSIWHQNSVLKISSFFYQKLKGKKCQVFIAPADVIFEILSPSTSLKDKRTKKDLYEKFGVKEYVLVNTTENYFEYYHLKNGAYTKGLVLGPKDSLVLDTLRIKIPLAEFLGQENGMDNVLPFKSKSKKS